MKTPENKAGNLPATKTIPQNVNCRERRQSGQPEQRERISEERNHAGMSNCIASNSPSELPKSSAIKVVIWAPHCRQASAQDCCNCVRLPAYCWAMLESM